MSCPLTKEELDLVRKAGSILRECMDRLADEIKEGRSTLWLERKADSIISQRNARAAFKGYKGFPRAICTSLNKVVVHGIPSESDILKDGDIVGIDVGVEYKGCYADSAKTFKVGKVSPEAERLVSVTEEALSRGIAEAKKDNHIQDISWSIQSFVESSGFSVVRSFVGHGIGKNIHEEPEIPNFGEPHKGRTIKDGMVLAIEPMVNAGAPEVEIMEDGWTAVTKDRKLSCHFEHTVIVNPENTEIVT